MENLNYGEIKLNRFKVIWIKRDYQNWRLGNFRKIRLFPLLWSDYMWRGKATIGRDLDGEFFLLWFKFRQWQLGLQINQAEVSTKVFCFALLEEILCPKSLLSNKIKSEYSQICYWPFNTSQIILKSVHEEFEHLAC